MQRLIPPMLAFFLPLFLAGCATGLKEIKPQSDLSADENRTFVYGVVETSANTKFNMQFKNEADQKMYSFSTSKFGLLPFGKERIPFSFQMKPGKWKFVAMGLYKGSGPTSPAGVDKEFEVKEGMGNFIGNFSGFPATGMGAGPSFTNISISVDKPAVDSLMAEQYSSFDAARTVAIPLW